jgi:hypothetical protein
MRSNYAARVIATYWGSYVTMLYILMKLLFLLNVLAQFVVLNHFLGPQYTFWGFGILNDILNGRQWQTSGHFPRVCLYCLLSLNVSR